MDELTIHDVVAAWREQLEACDRLERLMDMPNPGQDKINAAWCNVNILTEKAIETANKYYDQYRRRRWLPDGTWELEA